jgi:hypothetical protein
MTTAVANPIYVNGLFVTIFVTTDFDGPFELVQNRFFETKTPSVDTSFRGGGTIVNLIDTHCLRHSRKGVLPLRRKFSCTYLVSN